MSGPGGLSYYHGPKTKSNSGTCKAASLKIETTKTAASLCSKGLISYEDFPYAPKSPMLFPRESHQITESSPSY